jgi:hypothetical protein
MEDLKLLFKKRDEHHSKETLKIFKQINTTLGCVSSYLYETDPSISQGIMSWEDLSLVDDLVILVGMVTYEVGTEINLGGLIITVDEENLEDLQSFIHMSVPLALVEEDDEDKLMDYLFSQDNEGAGEVSSLGNIEPAKQDLEFDLSELTEEQRQALKLTTPKGGH